ncbi:MAG: hypothetical protein Kow0025_00500 [Thermodesulfovibrionales bacterium]
MKVARLINVALAMAMLAGVLLFAGACAGPSVKVEPIPVTANPAEQVSALDSDMVAARRNQINVLAPASFARAEGFLQEARRGLGQGEEISKILENVAYGKSHLKKAQEIATVAKSALPEVIEAREDARAAGATAFAEDYPKAEEKFLDLTRAIENDNLNWARQNKGRVVSAFRDLELRAIKEQTLGEVRRLIEQAEREGARKVAPDILADAKAELQAVDAFISENPYEKEAMLKKADAALFNAQRMLQIMRESENFRAMKPVDIAVWVEDRFHRMSGKLSSQDLRNEPLATQADAIAASIEALAADRGFMVDQVKGLQNEAEATRQRHEEEMAALKRQHAAQVDEMTKRIASLEGKGKEEQAAKLRLEEEKRATEARLAAEKAAVEQRLAAERQFNQLYNEVQTYFGKDEAEVYKQGNQLVIRLRAMQFPVGKAIIMPDNYSLLSKVQRSIRSFRDPEVVVEGHTDSTGAAAFNEVLSQQRADAVRQYLVANGTLPSERISSIGYGSVRPLASNETAEGRAINRRIDVVITPRVEFTQQP